ncbi:MAG: DUF4440 domain-containing protein [Williamsia sp.]|nr:DUF4440 domain-containing protein [Williamsia sp.]
MKKIFLYAVSTLLVLHAYTQPGNNLSRADHDNLVKTHQAVTEAAHKSPQTLDWSKFVKAHYADDAILMPPNAPLAQGQNAIIALFKSWPALTKFETHDVEVEGNGNLAFIRGTYSIAMKMNKGETSDSGKYIEVWRKDQSGAWKCIRDIFNSNNPLSQ